MMASRQVEEGWHVVKAIAEELEAKSGKKIGGMNISLDANAILVY